MRKIKKEKSNRQDVLREAISVIYAYGLHLPAPRFPNQPEP